MKRGLLRTGKECLKENSQKMTCIVYSRSTKSVLLENVYVADEWDLRGKETPW